MGKGHDDQKLECDRRITCRMLKGWWRETGDDSELKKGVHSTVLTCLAEYL